MKKYIFKTMLLLLTAGMSVACSSDNDSEETSVSPDDVLTPITITARYASGNETRVACVDDGDSIAATWQESDKLLVLYKNMVNTLTLSSGAGTSTATFKGTIKGSLMETSTFVCIVKEQRPMSITVDDDGRITYSGSFILEQDGTLAGATKCNFYRCTTRYGDGKDITCDFIAYASYLKFTVQSPADVAEGQTATLTYVWRDVADISKATFTVGHNGINTVYMAVPAQQFDGKQSVVYVSGGTVKTEILSETGIDFKHGCILSKTLTFDL
jgi:hypothetical protein